MNNQDEKIQEKINITEEQKQLNSGFFCLAVAVILGIILFLAALLIGFTHNFLGLIKGESGHTILVVVLWVLFAFVFTCGYFIIHRIRRIISIIDNANKIGDNV